MSFLHCTLCAGLIIVGAHAQTREKRVSPIDRASRESFERQTRVAVLVGIGAYPEGTGLSPLKYPAKDVSELAAELEKDGYAVRQLVDSQASRGVIVRTLNQLAAMLDPDQGTFVFYFSGHGFAQNGVNYLATFGATADDLPREGLSVTELEQLLKNSKARRQVMWIDACRSNSQAGAREASQRTFSRLNGAEGMRVLYATRAGGVSYEDDSLNHGVFTHYLLNGLRGEAAGVDGLVTFQDLASYVSDSVLSFSLKSGRLQRPFEAGEAAGDFLLAIKTSAAAPPPSLAVVTPSNSSRARGFDVDALLKTVTIEELDVSSDGMVAFTATTPTRQSDIFVMALSGGTPQRLTNDGKSVSPHWSPDGRTIAFLSWRSGARRTWVMNRDGSGQTALFDSQRTIFLPDGSGFVFRVGLRQLRSIKRDGSGLTDLTSQSFNFFDISPDGTEVCFHNDDGLHVVPAAGGAARRIAATRGPVPMHYSPDGKYLAYLPEDSRRLMVLERATGQVTALDLQTPAWKFAWSPDSANLFFTFQDRGRSRIARIPAKGGNVQIVASGDFHIEEFQFTRDGRSLVYSADSGAKPSELFQATSDGQLHQLTHFHDWLKLPEFSETWISGEDGSRFQTLVLLPPRQEPGVRYPVVILQKTGAWGYGFRAYAQVFADAGYVVAFPQPPYDSNATPVLAYLRGRPDVDSARTHTLDIVGSPNLPIPDWYRWAFDQLKPGPAGQ